MTSYKASHTNNFRIRQFNRRLSRLRIDIKHAFEILKKRWKSLIELRLQIRNKKNYIYVIRWITIYVMLHNILLSIQNEWDKNEEWWTFEKKEAHEDEMKHLTSRQLMKNTTKKEHVKELILTKSNSWNFINRANNQNDYLWNVFFNSIFSRIMIFSCCSFIIVIIFFCLSIVSWWWRINSS